MDVLLLLTLVVILSGGVIAAIQKAYPMALLCLGLALTVLVDTGLVGG